GSTPVTATNSHAACAALESSGVAAALVDLGLGTESGFTVIRHIKERAADVEIVVMSATTSVASAIQSYELAAFAFVPKPFDMDHLFATVARALEHRRMNLDNQRLMWELHVINELGDELRRALSIGSSQPDRYDARDEQLLCIIAGQIASAVQNARLHSYARLGKVQWEATFDAISDPIAVFDAQGRILRGNAALAAQL